MKPTKLFHCSIKVAAALLLTVMLAGLTACSKEDKPVNNVSAEKIVGKWYAENNTPGSINADGVSIDYYKLVQYADFRADGTGFWSIIFVDKDYNAIDIPDFFCGGTFNYTINGNTITITMASAGLPILKDSWDVTYKDGHISVDAPGIPHSLDPIIYDKDFYCQRWLQQLGFGYSKPFGLDIGQLTEDFTIYGEMAVTGTLTKNIKLYIADGGAVALNFCNISPVENGEDHFAGITCLGSAEIHMTGGDVIVRGVGGCPGIFVPEGSTVRIGVEDRTWNMYVYGSEGAAAIGSGSSDNPEYAKAGNIVVYGGVLMAFGGNNAAAIGSGKGGSCGSILISPVIVGALLNAEGGSNGPGLGAGTQGTCGPITLTGPDAVYSTAGGYGAPAIGAAIKGKCGVITLDVPRLEPKAGTYAPAIGAANDDGTFCDTIKFVGGRVYCHPGEYATTALGEIFNAMGKCAGIYVGGNLQELLVKNDNARNPSEIMHASSYSSDTEERTKYFNNLFDCDIRKSTSINVDGMQFWLNGPKKSINIGYDCTER